MNLACSQFSFIEPLEPRIAPAVLMVTSILDDGSDGTLRKVVDAANATPASDTVIFKKGLAGTILLDPALNAIHITAPLVIKGPGVDKIIVSGENTTRALFIADNDPDPAKFSAVSISNIGVIGGVGGTNGGAIVAFEPLTLANVVMTGGSVNNQGGDLWVGTGGRVSITGCKFLNGVAPNAGGGLSLDAAGGIAIDKTTVAFNQSFGSSTIVGVGGGLFASSSGLITINNSSFVKNSAEGGGGIELAKGRLAIGNTAFRGNSAEIGGGITTESSGVALALNKTVFFRNSAGKGGVGGVLYRGDGAFTISGSQFLNNDGSMSAGALSLSSGATVRIIATLFSHNHGASGGAIATSAGSLTVVGSAFTGNTASRGGALELGGSTATILHSIFRDNSATTPGGAIDTDGVANPFITIIGSLFQQNASAAEGGAVSGATGVWTIKTSRFVENESPTRGGAIDINGGAFSISGSQFQSNSAVYGGGAILVQNGSPTISASTFLDNLTDATSGLGGAIDILSNGAAMTKLKVTGNVANNAGGINNSGSNVTLTASIVSGNFATFNPNLRGL